MVPVLIYPTEVCAQHHGKRGQHVGQTMSVKGISFVLVVVQWKGDAPPLTVMTHGVITETTLWAMTGVRKVSQKKLSFTRRSLRSYPPPNAQLR